MHAVMFLSKEYMRKRRTIVREEMLKGRVMKRMKYLRSSVMPSQGYKSLRPCE